MVRRSSLPTQGRRIMLWLSLFQVVSLFFVPCCHGLSHPPVQPSSGRIMYVCGQRVRYHPSTDTKNKQTPIVLLGGMAQTISSWDHHVAGLSRDRDLLIYECLGQGPTPPDKDKEVLYHNTSLPMQAQLLCDTIEQVFPTHDSVDIVGFSLGGRVAMAAAAVALSTKINRLHLTGVAAHRAPLGSVVVESWKDLLLHQSNVGGFAWSALLATYSPNFLHANRQRLATWIQNIQDSNTVEGLQALLEQASLIPTSDLWHTTNMAERMQGKIRGRLVVGELDSMSPLEEAQSLLDTLGWHTDVGVVENCGHAVPMEQPRLWRNDVLSFLNED